MDSILIQEADTAILDILSVALETEGYQVYGIADGEQDVLGMIQSYQARIVILDCWVRHNSSELCHWIKLHCPDLPVIALSCDNDIEQRYRCMGFDAYLKKPFDLDDLFSLTRNTQAYKTSHPPVNKSGARDTGQY